MSAQVTIFLTGLAGMLGAVLVHLMSAAGAGREAALRRLLRLPPALGAYAVVFAPLAGLAFGDWRAALAFMLGSAIVACLAGLALARIGRDAGAHAIVTASALGAGVPLGLGALSLLGGPGPMPAAMPVCFALGVAGAALLVRSGDTGAHADRAVQLLAFQGAAASSAIVIALALGAADTALLGPQQRLAVLPAALLAAGLPGTVAAVCAAQQFPGAAFRWPWTEVGAAVWFLGAAFAVVYALDVASAVWFLLLAGAAAGVVLAACGCTDSEFNRRFGSALAATPAVLASLVVATAAVALPEGGRLYGLALAAVAISAVAGPVLARDIGRADLTRPAAIGLDSGAGMLSALAATGAFVALVARQDGAARFGFDEPAFMAGLFAGGTLAFLAVIVTARDGEGEPKRPTGASDFARHYRIALRFLRRGAGIAGLFLAPAAVGLAFGSAALAGLVLGSLVCAAGLSFAAPDIAGLGQEPARVLPGLINALALASLAAALLFAG